jgi:hypothetical protein
MFSKLRERDPATRERYAGIKGRTRHDRRRADRGRQAWR